MKATICYIFIALFCCTFIIKAQQFPDSFDFEEEPLSEIPVEDETPASFFSSSILEPMRLTFRHEFSYKVKDPYGMKNNRSSFRLEYKKFFLKKFYAQLDYKLKSFWTKDHRSEANNGKIFFENNFIEAFSQFSIKQTSIKVGIQKMIWGESEAGAIIDVISPRDYSELFFISLEESRRGQPMISLDQFTKIGDLTVFFVPFPTFNRYPKLGTAYYYDAFNGSAEYQDEQSDKDNFEYGLKWKKTFGNSDLSFMTASLIDNDYAYRMDGYTDNGQILVTKMKERFNMAGMTFNYAIGDFILKGEAAIKLQKAYNNATYQIVKKDAVDAALGLDYIPGGGSLSFFLETVNKHVIDWNDEIQMVPENTNLLVLTCRKTYFNQYLTLFWMTIYSSPYTNFLHELLISYKLNDNFTLFLNGYYPDVRDQKNINWIYRDQKQVVFKIQYQF